MSALPLYISPEEVDRTIACCDVAVSARKRNRAILLLMSVLVLSTGDIVNLRMTDIDWSRAELRVCDKSRCEVTLSLPQAIGDVHCQCASESERRASVSQICGTASAVVRCVRGQQICAHRTDTCHGYLLLHLVSANMGLSLAPPLKRGALEVANPQAVECSRKLNNFNKQLNKLTLRVVAVDRLTIRQRFFSVVLFADLLCFL